MERCKCIDCNKSLKSKRNKRCKSCNSVNHSYILKQKNLVPWNKGLKGYTNLGSFKKGHSFNIEILKKIASKNIGKRHTNEWKLKQSIRLKKMYKEGTYHGTRGLHVWKDKIPPRSMLGKKHRLETILKMKQARAKLVIPKKDTSIEVKIQKLLRDLNLKFLTHQYIKEIEHGYQCDIFIPVQMGIIKKTIIECDGDYWHGNPKFFSNLSLNQRKKKILDEFRTKELMDKGYNILRLWEEEIKNIKIDTLKQYLQIKEDTSNA